MHVNVGSARVDITPPLTIPHLGYVPRQGKFKGVHDALYARALVFDNGESKIALVSADSIGFNNELLGPGRNFIAEVRHRIQQQTGIAGGNVMLASTHAHSAPETTGITRLLDIPDAEAWLEVLMAQLSSAVEMAEANMTHKNLKIGIGEARGIAKNRRKRDLSIDEQRTRGYLDESVGVLLCENPDDGTSDILINFACHPVTVQVQPLVSADYPGVATFLVEDVVDGCKSCLFLQGAAGDINPVRGDTRDFRDVELYGMILGGEVIKMVATLRSLDIPVMEAKLGAISKTLKLPSRHLPEPAPFREAYQAALKDAENTENEEKRNRALRVAGSNREILNRIERGTDAIEGEVQVLRIGNLAIVGVPGEMFMELGLQIKRDSPAPHTFIAETTNDWLGYIVSEGSYQKGGYEVQPGPWSMMNEEGGQIIVQTAIELIKKLWENN